MLSFDKPISITARGNEYKNITSFCLNYNVQGPEGSLISNLAFATGDPPMIITVPLEDGLILKCMEGK